MKIIFTFLGFLILQLGFSQDDFTLSDTSVHENQSLTTYRIQFEFDKANIRPISYSYLDSLVTFLQKNDSIVLEVRNHRDTRGHNHYSTDITQRRAKSVVNYLIEKGIEKERLIAKGYGDIQPLVSDKEIEKMNSKEEQEKAHQKNRRTEFVIISNGKIKK